MIADFASFLSYERGVMRKPNFPYGVTQSDIDNNRVESRIGGASLWEIRVGAEYRF